MTAKNTSIISKSLFSSSLDTFRTDIGGYWSVIRNDDGSSYVQFNSVDLDSTNSDFILSVKSQAKNRIDVNEETFLPNVSLPVRIVGRDSNIESDDHWRTVLSGGVWSDKAYDPIVDQGDILEYLYYDMEMPYTRFEHNLIGSSRASKYATIGCDYEQYIRRYQEKISRGDITEHLLPNYYILADLDGRTATEMETLYSQELVDYATIEGRYTAVDSLLQFTNQDIPYRVSPFVLSLFGDIRKRNTFLTKEYMPKTYAQNSYSGSTVNWASSKLRNMLFDNKALDDFYFGEPLHECLPYKVNINVPQLNPADAGPAEFLSMINGSNFSSKFLKTLYLAFSNNINELAPTKSTYAVGQQFYELDGDVLSEVSRTRDVDYREIDYIKFLSFCRNNYDTTGQNENCMFVGPNDLYRATAQEESGLYRAVNTTTTVPVLRHAIRYLRGLLDTDDKFKYINQLNHDSFFNEDKTYAEVLAYRVEKIAGPGVPDSRQQEAIQNFYFMYHVNEELNFYDSQVKYDADYTYNVYAYVLTAGMRYRKKDMVISRQIGCEDSASRVGLEFYNPDTGEASAEIFESDPSNEYTGLDAENEYGTSAQILSPYPYVADFKFEYEPFFKIVEKPIISKTIRVNDHPGNMLSVTPYAREDSSNIIGFQNTYGPYRKANFPNVINSNDQRYKNNYLNAYDFTEESIIERDSISLPATVEMYRLSQRPGSVSDFNGSLRKTTNMRLTNDQDNVKNSIFTEDLVSVNQKYYYLFRVLNQQGEISQVTDVFEVQLVDDGGYKYSVINV